MSAMYWFSKEIALKVEPKVQRGLFIFAVSNSCVNPIVYGKLNCLNTSFRHTLLELKFKYVL